MIPVVKMEDYAYPLTDDRIAKYPLDERDSSKLLIYGRDGGISESVFRNLPDYIPEESMLIFNDTKVVPARLHFQRESGARVEIFCLKPDVPAEYDTNFASVGKCSWRCVIGNSKRWKENSEQLICPDPSVADLNLKAKLLGRDGETGFVEFSWSGNVSFSTVLERCGNIPIPPYLNRETEAIDVERYQTTYARIKGSVAAPTAGLHFTDRVLERIKARGVKEEAVCLHVGAGTFLPVKTASIDGHVMHREPFTVKKELVGRLARGERSVTAVGTTSVRTLESLYYVGVSVIEKGHPEEVAQWAPYDREYPYSTKESLEAIVKYLDGNGLKEISVETRIIIVPGFKFRIVDRLVTNFHQSESTLILLVSAFVGGDWRRIYDYALAHEFRFLSYGDSSLLFRKNC